MTALDYLSKNEDHAKYKGIELLKVVLGAYLFKLNKKGKRTLKVFHILSVVILIAFTILIFHFIKPNEATVLVIANNYVSLAALAFVLYAIIFVQQYEETRKVIITLYYNESRPPEEKDANGRLVEEQYDATQKDKEFLLGNGVLIIVALFISALLGVFSILFSRIYWLSLVMEIIGIIIIELVFLIISILLLNMVTDTIYVEYPKSENTWKNRVKR